MNKEEITVGDVCAANKGDVYCSERVFAILYIDAWSNCYIMFSDGEVMRNSIGYINAHYHKVGHIEKFAEALKELQKMAERVKR